MVFVDLAHTETFTTKQQSRQWSAARTTIFVVLTCGAAWVGIIAVCLRYF
jgi:hypothetical protein